MEINISELNKIKLSKYYSTKLYNFLLNLDNIKVMNRISQIYKDILDIGNIGPIKEVYMVLLNYIPYYIFEHDNHSIFVGHGIFVEIKDDIINTSECKASGMEHIRLYYAYATRIFYDIFDMDKIEMKEMHKFKPKENNVTAVAKKLKSIDDNFINAQFIGFNSLNFKRDFGEIILKHLDFSEDLIDDDNFIITFTFDCLIDKIPEDIGIVTSYHGDEDDSGNELNKRFSLNYGHDTLMKSILVDIFKSDNFKAIYVDAGSYRVLKDEEKTPENLLCALIQLYGCSFNDLYTMNMLSFNRIRKDRIIE